MILLSRGFLLSEEMNHVQLPLPIRGASQDANFRETSQWSIGTAVGSDLHSKIDFECFLAEYILSSLDSLVLSFFTVQYVYCFSFGWACCHWSCTPHASLISRRMLVAWRLSYFGGALLRASLVKLKSPRRKSG